MPQPERRSSITQLLDVDAAGVAAAERVEEIPVDAVRPNPDQPRKEFPPESILELGQSIKDDGLQQPIIVRRLARPAGTENAGEVYELIAGERRLRAHQAIGKKTIKAIVRHVVDDKMLKLALIENLQREDLSLLDASRSFYDFKDRFHSGDVEAAAKALKVSRSTGFIWARLAEAKPLYHQLVKRDKLDVRSTNSMLGLADKVAKKLPGQLEEFEHLLEKEGVSYTLIKRLDEEYFPKEEAKTPTAGTEGKSSPAGASEREAFWQDERGLLHLELELSADGDGSDKSERRQAAAAAAKFFKAAGFKNVRIEP
jgi:ParB family chromosome partitioning protein